MNLPVTLAATVAFNALVAVFLTVLGIGSPTLLENMLWSQCIGLVIAALVALAILANPPGPRRVVALVGAVSAGAGLGVALALAISDTAHAHDGDAWQAVFIGLFFGAIASVFFWLRERNERLASELEARELARLEAEKRGLEAQLKMLQAQIEPHFLFNTLANLAGLIQARPELASQLLDALIRYLRASLARTRASGGSLGDEVALLKAYLEVLRIRMGDRLRFRFDVPGELLALAFPPMLLQPLVENAVSHGLEPKIEGGTVAVTARREEDSLRVEVSDDGLGFGDAPGEGVGLANIRARLAALYGAAGRLELSTKVGAGVTATIELPVLPEAA